jgi:hypothetical protein
MKLYAIDFGVDDALAVHGPDGPMKVRLGRVRGGASFRDKFIRVLENLIVRGDVVVESATVGSCGCEPDEVERVIRENQTTLDLFVLHNLYTLPTKAAKNYKADNNLDPNKEDHANDAAIIWAIAANHPERLHLWQPPRDRLVRKHTSVRPHDRRNYRGPEMDAYMRRAPRYNTLPPRLQQMFGGKNWEDPKADYLRARVIPLIMAMDEPGADTRKGYEKIIGVYEHGYPSFYRRKTIDLMRDHAKRIARVNTFEKVTVPTRKLAWRWTRKDLRHFYHLMNELAQGTPNPATGTTYPAPAYRSSGAPSGAAFTPTKHFGRGDFGGQGTQHPATGTSDPGPHQT